MSDASPFYGSSSGVTEPIIQPQHTDLDGNQFPSDMQGGVASPQILTHPVPGQSWMTFTGWTDKSSRHLWVAEYDAVENGIRNPTKVIDASQYGSVEGAHGFYDKTNDEWLLGMTTPTTDNLKLVAFSSDWSTVTNQVQYSIGTKDSGATAFAGWGGTLYLTYSEAGGGIRLAKIQNNYSTRPLSTSITASPYLIREGSWGPPNVHHVQWTSNGLQILYETNQSNASQWALHSAWTGPISAGLFADSGIGHQAMESLSPIASFGFSGGHSEIGQPFYSTEVGRPTLFFNWFRNLNNAAGSNTFRHEIWSTEVSHDIQDPTTSFPFRAHVSMGGGTGPSPYLNTFGASSLIVHAESSGSGTLTMRESASAKEQEANGDYTTRTRSLSTGGNRLVFDDPAHTIRFTSNVSLNSLNIELRR